MIHPQPVAVVLAAGFGTRLKPATEKCPKPLIPVAGLEPLFFALWKAHNVGIRDFVINAHYLHDQITHATSQWSSLLPGSTFHIVKELPEILGTGGAILNILEKKSELFKNRGLLLQNGDTLGQIDLKRLYENPGISTFAISRREDHLQKYNPIWISRDERFAGVGAGFDVGSGQHNKAHFLGVHYLSPQTLDQIKKRKAKIEHIDLFKAVYTPALNDGNPPKAVEFFIQNTLDTAEEFWFDMTNAEFLLSAQLHVMNTMAPGTCWTQALKARFPKLQEVSPRCYVQGLQQRTHNLHGPLVFVDTCQRVHGIPKALGPNLSVVCEHAGERIDLSSCEWSDSSLLIQNSIPEKGANVGTPSPQVLRHGVVVI